MLSTGAVTVRPSKYWRQKAGIAGQKAIGLAQGMGADQKIRRNALSRAFVAGVRTHDARCLQRRIHGQGVVVDLAVGQKVAEILFAGKVTA
jgi:hypothetical protein